MVSRKNLEIIVSPEKKHFFEGNGYVVIEDIVSAAELAEYRRLYDAFLSGEIECGRNRSDLGGHTERKRQDVENVTQIMWPSDFVPGLSNTAYYQRALAVARQLIGNDASFDFDMLIDKEPRTDSATPWHQDAAYWINVEDKRAASAWLALDDAGIQNGCMWYVPGSHRLPLRPHVKAGAGGGALECACGEDEGVPVPLKAGSCAFHHGATLHYSRGNTTDLRRRAYILNYRPQAMIEFERQQGFDHGRTKNDREIRNLDARDGG
jgi:phytanoyl-CoA hydroxylase